MSSHLNHASPLSFSDQIDLMIQCNTPLHVISKIFHYSEKELLDHIKSSTKTRFLNNPDAILKELEEPEDLCCPLTKALYNNPVTVGDGITYEKEAIEQWITEKGTSPTSFQPLTFKIIIPSNLHKSRVIEFREERLKKILFYVDVLLEDKAMSETLEKILKIAEDDARSLKREIDLINSLQKYVNIRKLNLFKTSETSELESLFDYLVKFEKNAQAVQVGDELVNRCDDSEKLESILKKLLIISNTLELKKKYKLKLYEIYMKDNNFDALQTVIVDHMANLVDDKKKRENVKSGIQDLMYVFKCKLFELEEDILKAVNEKLEGSKMSPIKLPEKPTRDSQ